MIADTARRVHQQSQADCHRLAEVENGEMWDIPFAIFLTKAESKLLPTRCPVKRMLAQLLKEAYPDERDRWQLVDKAVAKLPEKKLSVHFLTNLAKGSGDSNLAAQIWYDMHLDEYLRPLAEKLDRVTFKDSFENAFPEDCAKYSRGAERWHLVADAELQAIEPLLWNFDLVGRQPPVSGDIAAYLDVSTETQQVDNHRFGFREVWVVPDLKGLTPKIVLSKAYDTPQKVDPHVTVQTRGSGSSYARWVASTLDQRPLDGSYTAEVPVMTIAPPGEPLHFTAAMIVNTVDICDETGNSQPRDAKDAFVQALYAKYVGPRDRSGFITLLGMRFAVVHK